MFARRGDDEAGREQPRLDLRQAERLHDGLLRPTAGSTHWPLSLPPGTSLSDRACIRRCRPRRSTVTV